MSITFSRPFFLSVESCCRAQEKDYEHHFILRCWFFFFLCISARNKTAHFFPVTFICLLSLLIAMLRLPCHPPNCLLDLLLSKAGDRLHCLLFTHPFLGKALFLSIAGCRISRGNLRSSIFVGKVCQRICLESAFAEQGLCFCVVLVYLG